MEGFRAIEQIPGGLSEGWGGSTPKRSTDTI